MMLQGITIIVCGLLTASVVHGTPLGDCRRRHILSRAYHLADDKNCTIFYKCAHASLVKLVCPEGLHFNRRLEVCDWPASAGFSDSKHNAPTTSTAADGTRSPMKQPPERCPAPVACPANEDEKSNTKHFPHAYNCSQFCKCDHGVPIKFDCPVGLHFNPVLEVCDWPHSSNCSSMISNIPSTTSEPSPTFTELTTTTVEPLTDVPSTTSELSAENVYESTTKSTEETSPDPATLTIEYTTGAPTNLPTDTTESFTMETTIVFNVTDDTTVAPESTTWQETSTSSSATSPPPETTTVITTAFTENTTVLYGDKDSCDIIQSCPKYHRHSVVKHFPHPKNCSLYCRCNHGVAITEKCPVGLHFNSKLEVCDWPSNVNCK
ncbi:probable chitinase 10 isoform X2 [Schistocerca nitens]|uniref:probable chitinase 10 isoform X2 n=1 Tax=Schistocerca nitens TaxID=7011 RepID=UPI0021177696|nr:probable chitinase 10 isoform X2 [Schistocerca nitens]